MNKLMYEAPSKKDIERIVVTDKFIETEDSEPEIIKLEIHEEKKKDVV